MNLSEKKIYEFAYVLLFIPFIIFVDTYLLLPYALIINLLLAFGLFHLFTRINQEKTASFPISVPALIGLILGTALLVWLSGAGGYFPQKMDHAWRNPIFHDLIMEEWPVTYPFLENPKLVYYFNFWLVPAAIAKLFVPFGDPVAMEIGFFCLALWTFLWILEIVLLIGCKFKTFSAKAMFIIVIVFFGFSGLDCIGCIIRCIENYTVGIKDFTIPDHLERWAYCQYSSHFTQLAWVVNQAIPAWLCTILIFDEKNEWNYIGAFSFCLVYAPFPALGFAGIVFGIFASRFILLIHQKKASLILNKKSMLENLSLFFAMVPILCLFYLANNRVNTEGQSVLMMCMIQNHKYLMNYVFFIILEFGGYAVLVFKYYKRDLLFNLIIIELLLFPIFLIISYDFCLRSSIPALCLLSLFVISFFLVHAGEEKRSIRCISLAILFILGSITPLVEIISSLKECKNEKWRRYEYYTFKRPDVGRIPGIINFISPTAEQSFFFKYLAKK